MPDTDDADLDLTWREKGAALYRVATFRPALAAGVIALSVIAALLEGVGLSFIMPIVEVAQADDPSQEADGLLTVFLAVYQTLGVPFTLGFLVAGVAVIMTVRYVSSFFVEWLRVALETQYVRHLQQEAFDNALEAEIAYFDEEGSDDILNAIVTQAEYAGRVIRYALKTIEYVLLAVVYFAIAVILAPILTLLTVALLGLVTIVFRRGLDAGYSLGDQVADAKEGIQEHAQAGTQGVREVKLFGLTDELRSGFVDSVTNFERSRIRLGRNEAAINNFYQLTMAVTVFVLIYVALTFSSMSLGALGVFLFAMFRLGPKASKINKYFYRLEGELAHLVRTQQFVEELQERQESDGKGESVSAPIGTVQFDDVQFSYNGSDETVLRDVSFSVDRGEFVAFVGSSGAGKSTIVSLLSRMYEPDSGTITADGTPIGEFDIDEWRSRISVVRQDPYMFNETLRWNITAGNRGVSEEALKRVCEIAQVTEFLDDLPNGYDTILGDQGVRLSGGQRQRVAIARALLQDADLLILDEATSDLDSNLEKRVHTAIEQMERDYAIVAVAHRLSTVSNADCIYTMRNGQIIERGNHEELLDQSGEYSELYHLQAS